jgi:uncharacterized protein YutE (UPF0331/DUF86 family)
MNERIEKIAKEHGFIHEFMSPGEKNDALKKYEKFAQLIVKECIDICKDVNRNPYLEDEYQARQIIKNIEKHFGVKE